MWSNSSARVTHAALDTYFPEWSNTGINSLFTYPSGQAGQIIETPPGRWTCGLTGMRWPPYLSMPPHSKRVLTPAFKATQTTLCTGLGTVSASFTTLKAWTSRRSKLPAHTPSWVCPFHPHRHHSHRCGTRRCAHHLRCRVAPWGSPREGCGACAHLPTCVLMCRHPRQPAPTRTRTPCSSSRTRVEWIGTRRCGSQWL